MFIYLNKILYIYTDRSQMVRRFLWVKDLVSSILSYLIPLTNYKLDRYRTPALWAGVRFYPI